MTSTSIAPPTAALAAQAPRRTLRPVGGAIASPEKPRVLSLSIIALMVYLFVVHSYKLNIGTLAISAGLIGVMLFDRPLRFSKPFLWYGAFLIWTLLTMPASSNVAVSWTAWTDAFKIFLILFLGLNAIRNPQQHRLITLAWLGMFAFYPVRGTLFNFLSGNHTAGRYAWNFQFANFNDMAALTLIPLAMCIERLRSSDKKWVKACALAGLMVLPFIILITQSRAGMMGLALMLGYLIFRSRFRLRMIMAVIGVAFAAVMFAPDAVWNRISNMRFLSKVETLGQSDSSAEQRYVIWQVAGAIIKDHIPVGVGIGTYRLVHGQYAVQRPEWDIARGNRDTHSTYLHVLAETGFIGLALFMMIFVTSVQELLRTVRKLKGSEHPDDIRLRDTCATYLSAYAGLTICAVFGSLETIVFPFLFTALCSAAMMNSRRLAPNAMRMPAPARSVARGGLAASR